MKKLLCLALAASLSACASMPGNGADGNVTAAATPVSDRIVAAIDKAADAYQRARPAIDALIALLPADRQDRPRTLLVAVDYWIAQARIAASAEQALAALRQAAGAMQQASAAATPAMTPH